MLRHVVLAAAIFLPAVPVNAETFMDQPRQVIDLQKFACKQFLDLQTDGLGGRLIYWLDGNYRADENTVIDTDEHKKMLVALAGYCQENPTHSVSRAAERLFKDRK
jgi:hypothetical protein